MGHAFKLTLIVKVTLGTYQASLIQQTSAALAVQVPRSDRSKYRRDPDSVLMRRRWQCRQTLRHCVPCTRARVASLLS